MQFLIFLLIIFLFYFLNKKLNFLLDKLDLMIDDLACKKIILEKNNKEIDEVI